MVKGTWKRRVVIVLAAFVAVVFVLAGFVYMRYQRNKEVAVTNYCLLEARMAIRDGKEAKEVLVWLKKAEYLEPNLPGPLFTQATLYESAGKKDAALKCCRKALAAMVENPDEAARYYKDAPFGQIFNVTRGQLERKIKELDGAKENKEGR